MEKIDHLNVLIIDDCVESQKLLRTILQKRGFNQFQHACDGLEALDILNQNSQIGVDVDLILSDWRMPGMDGHNLLVKLKQGPHAHIPFIMTSVVDSPQEVYKVIQSGVSNYIIKPIEPQTLYRKIENVLNISNNSKDRARIRAKSNKGLAIHWSQIKHEIGHRVIDFQHQRIVDALHELNQPCDNRDEITNIFNRIKRCVLQHFEYEELQLRKINTGISEHLESHQTFLALLEEATQQHLSKRIRTDKRLLLHLSYWFADHIVEEDQGDLLLLPRKKTN
jgi:two-component system, chemotaxis family, chemotaxis protein CheY